MNQAEFIAGYNDKYREKFNPLLFQRSNKRLIEQLKTIILSCQRKDSVSAFSFEIKQFRVVTGCKEMRKILHDYEEEKNTIKPRNNKKTNVKEKKDKSKINPYDYIPVNDTEYCLLLVTYLITLYNPDHTPGKSDELTVIIKVPLFVDDYYMKINGKLYSTVFQIVDSSTYNMKKKNAIKVILKTNLARIEFSRKAFQVLDYYGQPVELESFTTSTSSKIATTMTYFFAKFGVLETLNYFGLQTVVRFQYNPISVEESENYFCFKLVDYKNREKDKKKKKAKKNAIVEDDPNRVDTYMIAPKYMVHNYKVLQAFLYAIIREFNTEEKGLINHTNLLSRQYWLYALGKTISSVFKKNADPSKIQEKGLDMLESYTNVYDAETKKTLRLPDRDKSDIFALTRWVLCQYQDLAKKNNLDVSTKRIRLEETIVVMFGVDLIKRIYDVYTCGKKVTLGLIKKRLSNNPDFLIKQICNSNLMNCSSVINDNDAINALKYTYKGLAGIGDKNAKNVQVILRRVDPSHVGIVDMDASSVSDPGMTGVLCPLQDIQDYGFFTQFEEPHDWEDVLKQTLKDYNAQKQTSKLLGLIYEHNENGKDKLIIGAKEGIDSAIENTKDMIVPFTLMEAPEVEEGAPLEASGKVWIKPE